MAYTTIKKPSDYFNTVLYTGNGSSQSITGVGFQPDFTWLKSRSGTYGGYNPQAYDVVRGAGTSKDLTPATTAVEGIDSGEFGYLSAFNTDGFTLTAGSSSSIQNNGSSTEYVSWNWLADNTSGSSNTQGDIASTVSANTTSGFSIVSWTGNGNLATIGHGLGVTPSMYIVKNRSITESWVVYHKGLNNGSTPEDFHLVLEGTDAQANYPVWNDTAPTSNVFTVNGFTGTNGNTNNMVAYCFADVKGFSKFGYYTANASDDGPMIYLGFKPALVIIKKTNGINPWIILDNKRGSYNVNQSKLFADSGNAENTDTSNGIDFLSNGFKIRRNNTEINGASGDTFIYMAFAEEPLVGDNPATAR